MDNYIRLKDYEPAYTILMDFDKCISIEGYWLLL